MFFAGPLFLLFRLVLRPIMNPDKYKVESPKEFQLRILLAVALVILNAGLIQWLYVFVVALQR